MSEHTPGPWKSFGRYVNTAEGEPLATADAGTIARENVANARLMAAAPDLLEALRGLLHSYKLTEDYLMANEQARQDMTSSVDDIIARAKGDESL